MTSLFSSKIETRGVFSEAREERPSQKTTANKMHEKALCNIPGNNSFQWIKCPFCHTLAHYILIKLQKHGRNGEIQAFFCIIVGNFVEAMQEMLKTEETWFALKWGIERNSASVAPRCTDLLLWLCLAIIFVQKQNKYCNKLYSLVKNPLRKMSHFLKGSAYAKWKSQHHKKPSNQSNQYNRHLTFILVFT